MLYCHLTGLSLLYKLIKSNPDGNYLSKIAARESITRIGKPDRGGTSYIEACNEGPSQIVLDPFKSELIILKAPVQHISN